MATNKVEIELELSGADEAIEGLEGIGETSKAMAERFQKDNSHLGEGLGDLTGNITDAVDSVKGLGSAFTAQGASMMSLVPAFGAVVAAGFALYETYLNISGAAEEAEQAQENMAAATSDLLSKLEALAEKGVVPTSEALAEFTEATLLAQFAKDDLETAMTKKLTPAMKVHQRELKKLRDLQKRAREEDGKSTEQIRKLGQEIVAQNTVVQKSRAALSKAAAEFNRDQEELIHLLKGAAEQEENFEKLSAESRLAVIKETEAKIDSLMLMREQTSASEEQAKQFESQQKQQRALSDLQLEANKDDIKFLNDRNNALKAILATLNAETIITARGEKERADLRKQAADKEAAEREKEMAQRQARQAAARAKRLAKERQLQAELRQIRSLEIESARINGASRLEILDMQYQEEVKAAEGNANQILIAVKRYENQVTLLTQEEEQKRQDIRAEASSRRVQEEKERAEQRANFMLESMEFNARLIKDETQRELALLELRYKRERELNEHTQEEITELNRREALEREQILNESFNRSLETMQELGSRLAQDSLAAVYETLVDAGQYELQLEEIKFKFDQDISQTRQELLEAQRKGDVSSVEQREKEITTITQQYEAERRRIRAEEANATPLIFGNILKGLGKEAAVESLMQIAKGTAALFDPRAGTAAIGHFKAAAIFAGAAAFAGISGAALTNKASGNIAAAGRSGGNLGTSPTGTPQTAPAPERERAEETAMVFNINFGGAVIYDTQRAAEQALADRITNLQNTRRRGAPRRAM